MTATPTQTKRARRLPAKFDAPVVQAQILEWVGNGKPLREFCRLPGSPNWRTVYRWRQDDPGFAVRLKVARDSGYDAIAEHALAMADEQPPKVDGRIDPGYVQWKKLQVWTRLQLLAKWSPKKYGEQLAIGGIEDAPPIRLTREERVVRIEALFASVRQPQLPAPSEKDDAALPAQRPQRSDNGARKRVEVAVERDFLDVVPRAWVREAQRRSALLPHQLPPVESIGVAIGRRGTVVVAARHGATWIADLAVADQGRKAVALVCATLTDQAPVVHVEASSRAGVDLCRAMGELGLHVVRVDEERSALAERLRAALDPVRIGAALALPLDTRLLDGADTSFVAAICLALIDTPRRAQLPPMVSGEDADRARQRVHYDVDPTDLGDLLG